MSGIIFSEKAFLNAGIAILIFEKIVLLIKTICCGAAKRLAKDKGQMANEIQTGSFHSLLVLPSATTIFFIAILFGFPKWRELFWNNKLILSLIAALLALNLIEVITYGNIFSNYDLLLRVYYTVIIISNAIFIILSERLNSSDIIPRNILYPVIIVTNTALIFLISSTDVIVAGAAIGSYSISRIPGDYFWLLQLYMLVCIITGLLLIWRSIALSTNPLDKKRRIVILFSLFPIIFTTLLVMFLMQLGIEITWSLFLPITTLIFVFVYLFTKNRNDLFRFLVNIPFSKERKAYKQLNSRVLEYISKTQTDETLPLKQIMSDIEQTFINNALEIKDGNHNLAAELLSISISTVYRYKDKSSDKKQTR